MARAALVPVYTEVPSMGIDGRTVLSGARVPLNTDGRVGDFWLDTAGKKLYGPKSAAGWPDKGLIKGDRGWVPVLASVTDGTRRVHRIVDWSGGEGTKPATGKYVGAAGLVDIVADAVDMRGAEGPAMLIDNLAGATAEATYGSLVATAEVGDDNEKRSLAAIFEPGRSMSFANVATAASAVVPKGVQVVNLQAYGDNYGIGAHRRRRVDSEPSHAGKHRSADRYMPDGGTDSANGGWWEIDLSLGAEISWFGAEVDGSTDDAPAIAAALSSGAALVVVPGKAVRCASGITIPAGVTLWGQSFLPGAPPSGTRLVFDAGVEVCVALGSGVDNSTRSLRNLTVMRAGGAPSASTIGVKVDGGYNVVLDNVNSYNHGILYQLKAYGSNGSGLGFKAAGLFGGKAVDCYIEADTWPELRVIGGRFGNNGNSDYTATSFVRIKGGYPGSAAGPNGIVFENFQFNQGSSPVHRWLDFVSLNTTTPSGIHPDTGIFNFLSCHIENVDQAGIYSDSSWDYIGRISIAACSFNCPDTPFLALSAATYLDDWIISNNLLFCSTFAVASAAQANKLVIAGNTVTGVTSISPGGSNSTGSIRDNKFAGNITFAGAWAGLVVSGNQYLSGTRDVSGLTRSFTLSDSQYDMVVRTENVVKLKATSTTLTGKTFIGTEDGIVSRKLRYTGTADGSGDFSTPHGLGAVAVTTNIGVSSAYKSSGGAWLPMTVNFTDGSNVSVSGGSPAAGRPVVIVLELTDSPHSGW